MNDAKIFKALHDTSNPLLLPNAWDAASARIIEQAGFPAIATTSAGVAWAIGYPDGEAIGVAEMVEAVRRIARVVHVPVTADFEAGYTADIDGLVRNVGSVLEAGAVGINLEDWNPESDAFFPLDIACARIDAVKRRFGDAIFVNARTDVYLKPGEPRQQYETAVARLRAFVEARADGVFAPGTADPDTIAAIAGAVNAPLNVLANKSHWSVAQFKQLGVARISLGGRVALRILGETRAVARQIRESGMFAFLDDSNMLSYAEADGLFR